MLLKNYVNVSVLWVHTPKIYLALQERESNSGLRVLSFERKTQKIIESPYTPFVVISTTLNSTKGISPRIKKKKSDH